MPALPPLATEAIHAFIVACMALMLCGGCFKYSQEIWINGDYSARIVTDFGLAHQISATTGLGTSWGTRYCRPLASSSRTC